MAKQILGLITARGGSKRVPGKNIKAFHGKPLLAWTVEVGKNSGVLDRFILSTDDESIAAIGKEYGVAVPFMRPAELASDTATSYQVVCHAVEWMKVNEQFTADWVILLEPSSPGRQTFHLQEVAKLIQDHDEFDSIIGISETPAHFSPLKALQMDGSSIVTRVGDGAILRNLIHRNQDVPKSYYINSAVYAFKVGNLSDGNNSLWGNATYGYVMDNKYAMDIDTPEDFDIAVVKMQRLLDEVEN